MVFTHKIVCRKSPKLYASYHNQTPQKTCFNLTEKAAFNLPNNTQGVDRFLPPAAEQSDHLADGVVQVDPPVLVRPAVLPGQLRPAQDKGIQHLRFVAQGLECGCFKKEIGEPGETERLFRLVNINRVCHSVFCGRLEARFPGRMINDTSRPG